MSFILEINRQKCIRCGKCVKICPSLILGQETPGGEVSVLQPENCIVCGHCVAVCPTGAVEHSEFPADKVHAFDYSSYPSAAQMMLLCKARRSDRAFSAKRIPEEYLSQIVEAAHRAPTASNLQQVEFTLVTDPVRLRMITTFTLEVFERVFKKMNNPLLRPLIKLIMPEVLRYRETFLRLLEEDRKGNDLILRKATAVLFIHTPKESRFGCQDANLAYQNGSLMAECLGVSQFYTGFVCTAIQQEGKGTLEQKLGIKGRVHAGMALGMPAFRYSHYIDRKELRINRI